MAAEDAHRDAFWVITVVGGMSIVRAIDSLSGISLSQWTPESGVILCRFFVFLLTAVRFYIGSNVYFQFVHIEKGHELKFPRRNYVLDFASAILHFSILYAVARNIGSVAEPPFHLASEHFFLFLCAMLLYDWPWYMLSTVYSTAVSIRKWAAYNTFAIFLPCAVLFAAFWLGWVPRPWFELLVAGWIFISSLPDLIRMARAEMPEP